MTQQKWWVSLFFIIIFVAPGFIPGNNMWGTSPHATAAEKGLVAHWNFDEGRDDVAKDVSGNGNNGEISGAKWVKGVSGSALEFDGAEDNYVKVESDMLDGMSNLTVEFWIYVKGSSDVNYSPISKQKMIYRFIVGREHHFVVATENVEWYKGGTCNFKALPKEKWYHLAATYGDESIKVYVNGELAGEKKGVSGDINRNPGPLVIGLSDAPGSIDNFVGIIDEVKIYSRALTPNEIQEHYQKIISKAVAPEVKKEETKKVDVKKEESVKPAPASKTGLVAWYKFDSESTMEQDSSGNKNSASVANAECVNGKYGKAMSLDGSGGLEIESSAAIAPVRGFTLDLWIKFNDISQNYNLASKGGEFLLRIDPPNEGSNVSFFVNAGGSLEPRVKGLTPEPDKWYHIVASWDGAQIMLSINDKVFKGSKAGGLKTTSEPVVIGKAFKWAPAGLNGIIDEFKMYNKCLTESDLLLARYGLDNIPGGKKMDLTSFDFSKDAGGWKGIETGKVEIKNNNLLVDVLGEGSAIVNQLLDIPASEKDFISVKMAMTKGNNARILFATTIGSTIIDFPIKSDGNMHTYTVNVSQYSEWSGNVLAICLFPSNEQCIARISNIQMIDMQSAPPQVKIKYFFSDFGVNRAQRPVKILAYLTNNGGRGKISARITSSENIKILGKDAREIGSLDFDQTEEIVWEVETQSPCEGNLKLIVSAKDMDDVTAEHKIKFTSPVSITKPSYIPEPQPVKTNVLVGVHNCPLWDRTDLWKTVLRDLWRVPVLGFYDELSTEVKDWETKWAVEHGINFMIYCWYRTSQGESTIRTMHEKPITEGLFKSKFVSKMKFTIMWENQNKGRAGVANENDLLNNLLPYWIENFFKHPSYLKIDNKPLLFIYRPEFLINDLGSIDNVRIALDKMRDACRKAGFDGLVTLGEYRGTQPQPLQLMKDEGLDYTFAYCWPVASSPNIPPDVVDRAMRLQPEYWQKTEDLKIIPQVITITMGWSGWKNDDIMWKLPPDDFRTLCQKAKDFIKTIPSSQLGSKMVILDNWNEWGEGHFIMPYREYGFGHLDAVRDAFSDAPKEHQDLIPEDVGLGPYDEKFKKAIAEENIKKEAASKKITKGEKKEPGLIAWWTFDETDDFPVAFDYSGNGLGGSLYNISRTPEGVSGKALLCKGGSVIVESNKLLSPKDALTIECWLKTDVAGQSDKWFLNRIYGGGTNTGYRFGLSGGKLSFAIPVTSWSHHVVANVPVPTGKWVHVAATYDGTIMRVYMDGTEVASLERGGFINPNDFHLCLGNYEKDHKAFFNGLLDEVKMYNRALSAEEIKEHSRQFKM